MKCSAPLSVPSDLSEVLDLGIKEKFRIPKLPLEGRPVQNTKMPQKRKPEAFISIESLSTWKKLKQEEKPCYCNSNDSKNVKDKGKLCYCGLFCKSDENRTPFEEQDMDAHCFYKK